VISGAVSIAACFVATSLVDRIGRKPLLLVGSIGMAMRRAGLEARPCMGEATQGAFRQLLETPDAALAWDARQGALILMDPQSGLLMIAMGSL